ncbi:hypothetical protein H312_03573 [Anncaliia algerae PRA339]|uniref:Uncharacterized protein n=1 Tax=Anncaliia algerae PRA339 TaxID=1288291 RepID=A0A059EWI0_9MICR|nr:hypothetical protein H312_03573 [Anncaliia algerae PRA339]
MILSVFIKKKLPGKNLHPKHPLVQSICGIVLRPGRHFENFILARALKYLPTPAFKNLIKKDKGINELLKLLEWCTCLLFLISFILRGNQKIIINYYFFLEKIFFDSK